MHWWPCCKTPTCKRDEDLFDRAAVGTDWTVESGVWSISDEAGQGKVLKESGTNGALIWHKTPTVNDDQVVGYVTNEEVDAQYGLIVKWTGVPRLYTNYDPISEGGGGGHSFVDIHTGDVTSTFKIYQDGVYKGEKTIDTVGWADDWKLVRLSFGIKVPNKKATLSIGMVPVLAEPILSALCQQLGYYECLYVDTGKYCGLGNGGTDPVYFDDYSLSEFDIKGNLLCGPCDCNCENHCVPWNLTATFVKVSNSNPDCDDYDGEEVALEQVGHDDTHELPCPADSSCRCWWHGDAGIVFCENEDLDVSAVVLVRKNNISVEGAELSDFYLQIEGTMLSEVQLDLIEESSTCHPLNLVFGPWVAEPVMGDKCCEWNVVVTE